MKRALRPPFACVLSIVLAVALSACRGMNGAPDGRETPHVTAAIAHSPPSADDLASAVVDLGDPIGSIALTNGTWTDEASGRRVTLIDRFRLVADLIEDGGEEAVALMVSTVNGVDTLFAVVMDQRDERPHQVAAAPIGTGLQLHDAAVDGHHIVLTVTRPGGDPAAPGQNARIVVSLRDQALVVSDGAMPPPASR
jgi:hypothetical protein